MMDELPEEAQKAIREEWESRGHGNGKSQKEAAPAGASVGSSDEKSSAGVDDHYGSSDQN